MADGEGMREIIKYDPSLDLATQVKTEIDVIREPIQLLEYSENWLGYLGIAKSKKYPQIVQDLCLAKVATGRRQIGKALLVDNLAAVAKLSTGVNAHDLSRWLRLAEIEDSKWYARINEGNLSFNKLYALWEDKQRRNLLKKKPIQGRFQDVCAKWKEACIDHIITDPPYPREFLDEWSDLSRIASRILKPSGFCICYSGTLNLPEVFKRLSEYLIYYWQFILLHSGGNQAIHPRAIHTGYKPILIFQKPPFRKLDIYRSDLIKGTGREKFSHPWQQATDELKEIIKRLTNPNDIILDPFAGSGTTGIACQETGRRYILIEKEDGI